jgi:hypothetical protein
VLHQETRGKGRPEAWRWCEEAAPPDGAAAIALGSRRDRKAGGTALEWESRCVLVASPDGDAAVAVGARRDREAGFIAPAWEGRCAEAAASDGDTATAVGDQRRGTNVGR